MVMMLTTLRLGPARARPIPDGGPRAHCATFTAAVRVRVDVAAPRLFPLFHLATLVLVLGDKFISFAIGRGAGSDGSLLLLSGLTKHGTETLDLKLELAAVVVILGDGLGDLFVALLELFKLVAGLEEDKIVSFGFIWKY